MDLSQRPRFRDFESRMGIHFRVRKPDGSPVGEWLLDACEWLPKPPLDFLVHADCFALGWSGSENSPQALYEIESPDGFKSTLFAVPVSAHRMSVTIN